MLVKIAVLTMTRARHDLLLAQVDGLSVGTQPPHLHSVVSMGDRDLTRGRLPLGTDRWQTVVKPVPTDRRALPIAAARNLAAHNAMEEGADVLVFLDDRVIPGGRTLERLTEAVTGANVPDELPDGPVLWRAPLLGLPPVEDEAVGYPLRSLPELARQLPGVPPLVPGQFQADPRWPLFSGACFAMSAEHFRATGGFCPDYAGHGLEDADFAEVVRRLGGGVVWVGGADAYLQPAEPVERDRQARYAVGHAQLWRERWGTEPDHPWITRLIAEGLLRREDDGTLVPATSR